MAISAEKSLIQRKCANMDELEDYIRETKNDLWTLSDCKTPFSDTLFFEMLKENMDPYGEKSHMTSVSAMFAEYERSLLKDPTTGLTGLLDILEKVGRDHNNKRQIRKQGKLGMQPNKDPNQDWCTTCKNSKHLKKDCWVLHPHLRPDNKGKKGDKGKGGGRNDWGGKGGYGGRNDKGGQRWNSWSNDGNQRRGSPNSPGGGKKGGDGGGDGAKEKCKYCGRRNHLPKDCKYKPPDADVKAGEVGVIQDSDAGPFANAASTSDSQPSATNVNKTTSLLAFLRGDLPRKKLGQVAVRKDSGSESTQPKAKLKPTPPDHPFRGCYWCHADKRYNKELTLYRCGYCDHQTCYECCAIAKTPKGHGVVICWHCRASPTSGVTKHECPDIITCNIARYQMDIDDNAFDTAATENIFNENSFLVMKQGASNHTTIIEGVGGDVSITKSAVVKIPCIDLERTSLTVPKIGTNAAAANRLVYEDGYIFLWSKRFGANLVGKHDYLRFDEVNGVPLFPKKDRPTELQDLCDAGYAAEIRKFVNLNPGRSSSRLQMKCMK